MPAITIILAWTTGVLCVVSAILFILYIRLKMRVRQLTEKIDVFIKHGGSPDCSLSENEFSQLENAVASLESTVLLERMNTASSLKQNAEFISDVSHQLKTPLAGIRLYCEMNETPQTEKQLILIEKMEKLVQSLLKLEKIKSNSYAMEMKLESLGALIAGTAEEFRCLYPEKTITACGDASLRCDRAWLSEAIGNTVKNSCEHTPSNGIIELSVQESERSITVCVRDNGGGVPEEALPKLFRRFYRSDALTPGSAGIGLAITKAIVDKHHGTVCAENSGNGLKITMCFPVIDGIEK